MNIFIRHLGTQDRKYNKDNNEKDEKNHQTILLLKSM